jgi:hypothetical protein
MLRGDEPLQFVERLLDRRGRNAAAEPERVIALRAGSEEVVGFP